MRKNIKEDTIFLHRIKILKKILLISFLIIFIRILYLNIYKGDYYKEELLKKTDDIIYGPSVPRGRIYDRNMNLLVDNTSKKVIKYKKESISQKEEIDLAYEVSKNIKLDYENNTVRNIKDFILILKEDEISKRIDKNKESKYKNGLISDEEYYEYKLSLINENDINSLTEDDIKASFLFYLMNKGYYYEEKIIKEDNVEDSEYLYISENKNKLKGFTTGIKWERKYLYGNVLKDILGSVSNGLQEDNASYYLKKGYELSDTVGISGIEKEYEDILKGEKSKYKLDDNNELILLEEGKNGNDIVLSIDINVQKELEEIISDEIIKTKSEANTEFYKGSYVVLQKPSTGEIYALSGKKIENNNIYDTSEGIMVSFVTPGSIVKGASITVGYKTKVIDIGTKIYDECIKLENIPAKCSYRKMGLINDLQALQYSSNVYQYKIAMMVAGFDYSYGKKLVIDENAFNTYRNIFYQYGLGVKTGIDYPKEDIGYKGKNKAGDLLINYSIGQYDTYTPIQLSQYISTIANKGERVRPHLLKSILNDKGKVIYEYPTTILNKVDIEDAYMNRIREGFRLVMTSGTGIGFINNKYEPSGKTGTSESFVDVDNDGIVDFESISNNFIGYAPSNDPIMSIVVSSPDVQNPNRGEYKSDVNYRISRRVSRMFFKYY